MFLSSPGCMSRLMEFGTHRQCCKLCSVSREGSRTLLDTFNHLAYLFTYLLTAWCKVLLEKLTGSQLPKKFPTLYGARRFITAFQSARHLFLSWVRSIQSMPPSHFLNIHLNIILPSTHGSFSWSLCLGFPHQNLVYASPHACYMSRLSHTSW